MHEFGVKAAACAVSAVMALGGVAAAVVTATADEGDPPSTAREAKSRIQQLLDEQDAAEARYEKARKEISTKVDALESKRAEVEQISKEITGLRKALGGAALAQYQAGPQDNMIFTADNPADYLNRLSTMSQVEANVTRTLQQLNERKAYQDELNNSLEIDRKAAQDRLEELNSLKKESGDKLRAAQAEYKKLAAAERARYQAEMRRRQAAADAANASNNAAAPSRGSGGGGASTPTTPVPNVSLGNRYFSGHCVWWAYERRLALGRPVGGNWGNGGTWAPKARAAGFVVNRTPAAGAVFEVPGHVGVVERVDSKGVWISEMNVSIPGGGWNIVSHRYMPDYYTSQAVYIH